jgi:hypothetical protein
MGEGRHGHKKRGSKLLIANKLGKPRIVHSFAPLSDDDNGVFFMPESGYFAVYGCLKYIIIVSRQQKWYSLRKVNEGT